MFNKGINHDKKIKYNVKTNRYKSHLLFLFIYIFKYKLYNYNKINKRMIF